MRKCNFCTREVIIPCMNTRDMEEGEELCYDALMRSGGGEYTINQAEAARRKAAWEHWKDKRK